MTLPGGAAIANAAAGTPGTAVPELAGELTQLAIADDCIRLAMLSRGLGEAVKKALAVHREASHLGGLLPPGGKQIAAILSAYRANPSGKDSPERLAVALGALLARAAAGAVEGLPPEGRLYRDAEVLRELHAAAPAAKPPATDPHAASELLVCIARRLMIGLHTFEPDAEDIDGWLERLVRWHNDMDALYAALGRAYAAPDPAKRQRFVSAPGFYDRRDPLIRIARSLDQGAMARPRDLEKALNGPAQRSLYGAALANGLKRLAGASAFLAGAMEMQAFTASIS